MIADDPSVIESTLAELRSSFKTNSTKDISFRKHQLKSLINGIKLLKSKFESALEEDLGLSKYSAELFSESVTIGEIEDNLKHIDEWVKPRSVDTQILAGPAISYIRPEPLGVVLILSAWNYPVYTAIGPLAAVIAAGNCAILKPSELAPRTSNVLKELFDKFLDPQCYKVIEGKVEVAKKIIEYDFDLIFFTGSPEKGKLIAQAAAKKLIPCILELGGKSPCIVDECSNLENAALRIIQGKTMNSGQTCVAPDYLFVNSKIKDQLICKLKDKIVEFYGLYPENSPDYGRIISEFHTQRLFDMINEEHEGTIIYGGKIDVNNRYVCPTLIENPKIGSKLMQEEIFGPILPILEYKVIDDVINFINQRKKPLALYYFGCANSNARKKLELNTSSGSFVVNEACFQLLNDYLPFGGVQNSGYGSYHGKFGFDGCSHLKAVMNKAPINIFPLSARFPPYTLNKQKIMLFLMKYTKINQSTVLKKLIKIFVIFFVLYLHKIGKFDGIINVGSMIATMAWNMRKR